MFLAVIRERLVSGLAWLHGVLKKDLTLLETFPENDSVTDFKERVQREISEESDKSDQAGEWIKKIATVLGIQLLQTNPPPEEEP